MEETAKDREERVQHAMSFLNDIIPHSDPNYWELLRDAAENYVDWEDAGCPVIEHDWLEGFPDDAVDPPLFY